MLLYMPVNHNALTAVAYVPFRHEVLVPGAELFGVRSAGCRRLAPDASQANLKHPIDYFGDGLAERLLADETSAHIGVIAESVLNRTLSGIEEGGARISQRPKSLLKWLGWPDVVAIEANVLPAERGNVDE